MLDDEIPIENVEALQALEAEVFGENVNIIQTLHDWRCQSKTEKLCLVKRQSSRSGKHRLRRQSSSTISLRRHVIDWVYVAVSRCGLCQGQQTLERKSSTKPFHTARSARL